PLEIGIAKAERAQPPRDSPTGMVGDEQDRRGAMRILHRHCFGFVRSQQPFHDVSCCSFGFASDAGEPSSRRAEPCARKATVMHQPAGVTVVFKLTLPCSTYMTATGLLGTWLPFLKAMVPVTAS